MTFEDWIYTFLQPTAMLFAPCSNSIEMGQEMAFTNTSNFTLLFLKQYYMHFINYRELKLVISDNSEYMQTLLEFNMLE